jgi:hypothetical protein
VLSGPEKTCAPADGGGRTIAKKNVAYMSNDCPSGQQPPAVPGVLKTKIV